MVLPLLVLVGPIVAKASAFLATKAVVAGAAHASSTVLAHAAYGAAMNIGATAAASGSATAAATILVNGTIAMGSFGYKVAQYRKKHHLDMNGKPTLGAQAGCSEEETVRTLCVMMLLRFYEGLEHHDRDGSLKSDLTLVDTCDSCACTDYDDEDHSEGAIKMLNFCVCGHCWGRHERLGKSEWLVLAYCQKSYSSLEQRRVDGKLKTHCEEISKCGDCECPDFDLHPSAETKTCECGHTDDQHLHEFPTALDNVGWILELCAFKCMMGLDGECADLCKSASNASIVACLRSRNLASAYMITFSQ